MTSLLDIRGVKKAFGSKQVLNGLDLTVEQGESVVIIGGSGTGKSVLLKCILGLHRPDAGSIRVDGEETVGLPGKKRDVLMQRFSMLFQGGALFDSLTVWENIMFHPIHHGGMKKKEAREQAVKHLNSVGLDGSVRDLKPAELSGGMQKRVALARAVATSPDIIFFDEPTTGLDPIMADVINDLIIHCRKEREITSLAITHDMASARKIATRIAMIYEGKIIWQGKPSELESSGNPYVEQFVFGRAEGPIKTVR
jgi:phospholipid/cholesterol/gamma-HCH transport system ATP-binding protein